MQLRRNRSVNYHNEFHKPKSIGIEIATQQRTGVRLVRARRGVGYWVSMGRRDSIPAA